MRRLLVVALLAMALCACEEMPFHDNGGARLLIKAALPLTLAAR